MMYARQETGSHRLRGWWLAAAVLCAATLAAPAATAADKIDLNTATAAQLKTLPGVGDTIASNIIEHRSKTPFKSVDELLEVSKIGPATLEKIRPYVTVTVRALIKMPVVPTGAPPPAVAPPTATPAPMSRASVSAILERFAHEPSIREVHARVTAYADLEPRRITGMLTRARAAAVLPTLRFEVLRRFERDESLDLEAGSPDRFGIDTDNDLWLYTWITWELDRLLFDGKEVTLVGKIPRATKTRNDLLSLSTKLYFERRKLQIELMLAPPTTVADAISQELRLRELTAQLDALTGGWFSRAARKK